MGRGRAGGFDYQIKGNRFGNVEFKKLWVGTDYSVSGAPTKGHVDIDPIIVGAGIGYRFGTGYTPLR